MVKLGLWVPLEARPGKEQEVEQFLRDAAALVEQEAGTTAWFALRLGASMFGIFDAFADESAREAHLGGKVAAALMAKAPDLFVDTPPIQRLEVLAAKLP